MMGKQKSTKYNAEHCSDDALEAYAMERVSEAERDSADDHLLVCEPCRVRLEETEQFVHAMRKAAQTLVMQQAQESARKQARPAWFQMPVFAGAGLAALALAVVVTVGLRTSQTSFSSLAPYSLELEANKGDTVTAPSGRPLDLQLNINGVAEASQYLVRVVNDKGGAVSEATSPASGNLIHFRIQDRLDPGSYYVRLFASGQGKLLREYGIRIQ